MKLLKRLICGVVAGAMVFSAAYNVHTKAASEDLAPDKYEFRGAWMSTVYNIDWSQISGNIEAQKQDYINKVEKLKNANFNALIFQVRAMGDAFYPSSYSPWSQYITGTQGNNPGYDPLAFALEEAHRRNLEFHAWFNPFRISTEANFNVDSYISKLPDSSPLKAHKEWIVKYSGNKTCYWINLGIPEARQYVIDTIAEVVRNYNIDAVHLDDYFYPYPVYTTDSSGKNVKVDFPDSNEYRLYGSGYSSKDDWRRDNVNKFVRDLAARIKQEKANVKFGISPFGIWKNSTSEGGAGTSGMSSYYDLYTDSKAFITNGWIDYIIPQIYWNMGYTAADYKALTDWWATQVIGRNTALYIGHAAYKIGDTSQAAAWGNPAEIPNQIKYNRTNSYIKGSAFYSTRDILANKLGIYDELKNNLYVTKALIPSMPWRDAVAPEAPSITSAVASSNYIELKWNKSPSSDAVKYVIYRFKAGQIVNTAEANKIAAVVDNVNSYKDYNVNAAEKYIYTVTALDAYGNESSGSTIDMRTGKVIGFKTNKASPQKMNTVINLAASASGGGTTLYRMYVEDKQGWRLLQDYSPNTSLQWLPSTHGRHNFRLEVKDSTSAAEYDTVIVLPYYVKGLYTVTVDPGHGGSDSGAIGYSQSKEKDINLSIALKLRDILDSRGIEVFMTRDRDKTMELAERSTAANRWMTDLFVSVHQNSYVEPVKDAGGNVISYRYPEGIEIYSFPGSASGAALASKIQDRLIKNTGAVNRGAKTANFHVIKETDMTAVLVECGFITNPTEEAKLLTSEYQYKIATAIGEGILQYSNMNTEDVDKNGNIDEQDLAKASGAYNTKRGEGDFQEVYDINYDGVVDVLDLALISKKLK
ncbi:family 10 glycosylhydrolase [Clostridium thermarum]|uniref:family 10 glycosylhydrolase n=1 Tax=Clostridium thermarum TaxID=1716543 RepID=UPI0013CF7320|nr:family 10 glycosylhydrolase [Clostridium thermarum]